MNKMAVLLNQLQVEEDEQLAGGVLKEVTVDENDCYSFFIALEEPLSFQKYIAFQKALARFPYPAEAFFETRTPLYVKDEVLLFAAYFAKMNDAAQNLKMDYEGDTLTVYAVSAVQKPGLEDFAQALAEQMEQAGYKIYCRIAVDDQDEDFLKLKADLEKPQDIQVAPVKKEERPVRRYKKEYVATPLKALDGSQKYVSVEGFIFKTETAKTKAGKAAQTLWLTDYEDAVMLKRFEGPKCSLEEMNDFAKGNVYVAVRGEVSHDNYEKELVIYPDDISVVAKPDARFDDAENKRIELHLHTNNSAMDGISDITSYVKRAREWGYEAIALTDHNNVQSFPEAEAAAKKYQMKMIYGVELSVISPDLELVKNARSADLSQAEYISFDLETTGLSCQFDEITEFGAVKISRGEIVDRFQTFVKPSAPIPDAVVRLTHITNEMVRDAPDIATVMPEILAFFGDDVLVAHNAEFDIGFMNEALKKMGRPPLANPYIDSLPLARAMLKPMKSYRLGAIARAYKVSYDDEVAHRADYDAEVLGRVVLMMFHQLLQEGVRDLRDLNAYWDVDEACHHAYSYHMTVLAKNQTGLKDLFKLVTETNTTYFNEEPRVPKELVAYYRQELLVGSSCYKSDVFEAALNSSDEKLAELVSFYDYIEIQPLEDYEHVVARGNARDMDRVRAALKRLIAAARKQNKIIVATGDVHFLDPEDKIFREVFITNPTIGINHRAHPLCDRKNPRAVNPDCYFRTTGEMLASYSRWLDEAEAYELVVTNPKLIAGQIEEVRVVHDQLYTPAIAGADEKLSSQCYATAKKMYGDPLPDIVASRLDRELNSIIKHGFGVIYYIASRLVRKSNEDGYLVGSRGSVGSSLVATLSGITEVNPLPPHYRCPRCGYSEFVDEKLYPDGFDLEPKLCPVCHEPLIGDGHNIPFETFLGFDGDKVPDIDLNFSGDYQWRAHDYTKVLFGEDKVYRAGTINTVANKTAYGFARGYGELLGIDQSIRSAQLEYLAQGCSGVKRTTGQHPGGIIVIPKDMDVYDFTPVQYPADDTESLWKTTHFDFHAIHDNVLKLDILGHVDPTVIRMLQDMTGVDPKTIPNNDPKVLSLFNSCEAMGIDLGYLSCQTGALGLPEFGTPFVRSMLEQTHPQTFHDLLIISGLSHGTNVWVDNADLLIRSGTCSLQEVIGCRDDIMIYLLQHGLEPLEAFKIMEFVRKGNASRDKEGWQQWVKVLEDHHIASWYIDSCAKIQYMFPKAHATAYVLSAVRVAWWKLYYPLEYYAVYFTTRCDAFEIETMVQGKAAVLKRHEELGALMQAKKSTKKDDDLYAMFEICLEMYERGFHFSNISLAASQATRFIVDKDHPRAILPPFSVIDGLGEAVAQSVIEAREDHPFLSKEDVIKRTRLNNSHIKFLTKMRVFEGMQEENQLSLF